MPTQYPNPPIIETICEIKFTPTTPYDPTIPGLFYSQIKDQFPQKKQQKQNNQANTSCAVIFLILVVVFIFFILAKPDQSTPSRNISQPTQKIDYTIEYSITGNATSGSMTWKNNTGGTEQGDYKIPFTKYYTMQRGDFLYISAQNNGRGTIQCEIIIDGTVAYNASSSGEYAIATCSGTVK